MATHENKEVKDHMQAAGAQHGHGTIDPGVLWKIQFDKDKWEQRGREMAEREQRVESEGFHHQHHHVPLPVPHPTFLVFPSEAEKGDIDIKAQEWSEELRKHGYADAYLRVSVPSRLYVKFELLETKPEEKEQKLTLQEVAQRFESILQARQDVREVHTLPLPSQTPDVNLPGGLMSEKQVPHY